MKTKITQIIRKCAVIAFVCFTGVANAATFTAVSSGSWSSTATWAGGMAPGNTIGGIDNVVINSGVTVTLDMDVTVNSFLSYIQVNGTLNSTSSAHMLDINSGDLSGNGTMNLHNLRLGTTGAMTFTGTASVDKMWNNNISISLANQLTIDDTLFLESGNLTLGSGGYLTFSMASVIRVDDGSFTLGDGIVNNSNDYEVQYVGSSKNMGFEVNGTGLTDVWIDLDDNTQSLSVVGNTTINGTLHHNTGDLDLNGGSLTLMGNYVASSSAEIIGSSTSNLSIMFASTLASSLMFSPSADELNDLWIENSSGSTVVGSDLTINGTLTVADGNFNMGGTLTMANGSEIVMGSGDFILSGSGSFDGSNSYSVTYNGSNSSTAGVELSGSGLENLTIDLVDETDSIQISNSLIIDGTLDLENGTLDMNGHDITLEGSFTGTSSGWFNGDVNSDLTINTTSANGDTLWFETGNNTIGNLTINTGDGSYVGVGTNLYINNLTMTNGGVMLWDGRLFLNSTGTITGANEDNYVMILGDGSLAMHLNVSSPYTMFPVGTEEGYSPASLQQNAGTAQRFYVNVRDGVWSAGLSGTNNATTESVVDRTWHISPESSSGSFDANLRVQWNASMEVNGFDRTDAYISHYTSSVWDAHASGSATSLGGGWYQMERMNINSFSPFAVVDEAASVTVAEIGKDQVIQMYPNPVQDVLTCILNIEENTTVDLVDLTGKVLHSERLAGKSSVTHHSIDFSAYPNGIYFVRYTNSTGTSSYKIVKS